MKSKAMIGTSGSNRHYAFQGAIMSDVPTRRPQDAPTPPVPRRPERSTDPVPSGKEPPTIAGDWLNLHQTVPLPSKPAGNGNVPLSGAGSGSGFHAALPGGTVA